MTDFFYSLPIWQSTILVLGAALTIGLGGSLGCARSPLNDQAPTEEKEIAFNLMQVAARLFGLMIGFARNDHLAMASVTSSTQAVFVADRTAEPNRYQDLALGPPSGTQRP